jgi:hypothetical protein
VCFSEPNKSLVWYDETDNETLFVGQHIGDSWLGIENKKKGNLYWKFAVQE